jgi:cytochrome c5
MSPPPTSGRGECDPDPADRGDACRSRHDGPLVSRDGCLERATTPLELQGAIVLQNKQCRNCHSLGGEGGHRGPALDGVGTRLTQDQLIRQVLQGGGNMPAYGKKLTPAEVTALVAFMQTLRPPQQPPARSAIAPAPGR